MAKLTLNGVVIDFSEDTLRDRKGLPIALRPQSFAVLRLLAEHPNTLVRKEEIMAAVWPGLAVTDDSLVQCIGEIRRALGDSAHRVVRTVPRRGYLLAAPEQRDERDRLRPAAAALGLAAAVAVAGVALWPGPAAPTDPRPLVAVLPFDAAGESESAGQLAAGLVEDLATDLTRFPEFSVLSRTTTGAAAGASVMAPDLGAQFLIAGSVRGADSRLRVTAKVIEASTGRQLWSDRWDRPDGDPLGVQEEISELISNRVGGGAGLVQAAGRQAARKKNPDELSVYDYYLLGTERLERVTVPDLEAAARLLRRAVEIEPGFARAWIELFHTHCLLARFGIEADGNRRRAGEAATQAVRLDPADPEAHAVAGMNAALHGDRTRARAEFETALRMAPNAAEILIFYAASAAGFGEAERGAEMADRAIELDPNFPAWAANPFAYAYFIAGRDADALAMLERLGPENYKVIAYILRAGALANLGRTGEASVWVRQALDAHPGITVEGIAGDPALHPVEARRLASAMQLAGFPLCEPSAAIATATAPQPAPECTYRPVRLGTEARAIK